MSWFWYKGRHSQEKTVADWNAPLPSQSEWRLEALYAWERRLRGYELFPTPVMIEPSFVPYHPDLDAESGDWASVPQPRDESAIQSAAGIRPLSFLILRLPVEQKVSPAVAAEFLTALRGITQPLSLEIVAEARAIRFQIACAPEDRASVSAAFSHCFPLARLDGADVAFGDSSSGTDCLLQALAPLSEHPVSQRVVDWGLYHPVYHPLCLFESFATDPHGPLLGSLGALRNSEVAGLQLAVLPARGDWAESLFCLVAQFGGLTQPAHPNTRDNQLERDLRYKLASPLWAVVMRVFAFVASDEAVEKTDDEDARAGRALDLCRRIAASLDATSGSDNGHGYNQLVALDDSGYPAHERLHDLLDRRSRRTGMLLSQDELIGLWHPPSERLSHPRLVRFDPRWRELPEYLRDAPGVMMGVLEQPETGATSGESPQIVPWPDAMRPRHLYMLGATRMGKSTLLLNLIAQDMLKGQGLCLIDPHGDLALDVLRRVPPDREDDVLYLDLSDTAHPPALGLLQAESEWEKRLLVSDLLAILHRLFRSSWGDRLEHILRHALLTLLAAQVSPFGTPLTLRDIRPLLSSKAYREQLLMRVPEPDLHTFWVSEFPGYSSSAFAPVYNKLGLLLSSPVVRNIIGGAQTKLHAGELMRERRVLVVNLAQSLIGEDNAHFLGALLVSKIQLAAMHNLRLGREERAPFTLYGLVQQKVRR